MKPIVDFLRTKRYAVLSTNSHSQPGYPFGSLVPICLSASGKFIISISRLAEHYRNLEADSRASLFVFESPEAPAMKPADPQANARATILGEFQQLDQTAHTEEIGAFQAAFPNSPSSGMLPDFFYFALTPHKIRWIGGFGDIRWVSCDAESLIQTDS